MNSIKPYHTFIAGLLVGAVVYHVYTTKVK
jgi:hypothetical protein